MKLLGMGALLVLLAMGCDSRPSTSSSDTPAASPLPSGLKLAAAPAGARDVTAVRASAKDGDHVVVRGVVAGAKRPLADNRAMLTLLDPTISTCDKVEGDSCTTPWDACCEPRDVLAKNTLTVQVVDADGKPLKTPLSGVEGVRPLARLTISGTTTITPDGNVLVNADGLFVE